MLLFVVSVYMSVCLAKSSFATTCLKNSFSFSFSHVLSYYLCFHFLIFCHYFAADVVGENWNTTPLVAGHFLTYGTECFLLLAVLENSVLPMG